MDPRLPTTIVLRRWRARRIARLLPLLMEEFHGEREPLEVLDCADAVVAYYEERSGLTPSLGLAHRKTTACLRAGVCEGNEPDPDPPFPIEIVIPRPAVTESPLKSFGDVLLT